MVLVLRFQLLAQPDSSSENSNSGQSTDSVQSLSTHQLAPGEARVVIISDSLRRSKRVNVHQAAEFYQYWKDQFPSSIIQYVYGSSGEQDYQIPRKQQSEDWKFYMSFLLLALLALIRFGYVKEFEELFTVFKNWGPSQQMYRELGTGVSFGTVLLNLFSAMVISFYVFLMLDHFGVSEVSPGWLLMIISVVVVAMTLLFRYLSLKLASLLLPFRKEITLYNFYEIQINRMLGVVIFPLLLLMAFSPAPLNNYAQILSLPVLAAFILFRYIKGFNIGINYFGRHLFHFLLYICALEIAPVLIIIRLLLNLGPLRFSF